MAARRDRAASVVLSDEGALLVIRRQKNGRNYCVLPGGGVEDGESGPDAALRELNEETGLSGRTVRELWTIHHLDRVAHYYRVLTASGPLELTGPELELQSPTNQHRPEWIQLSELEDANLQPAEVRPLLVDLEQDRSGRAPD
jgi:8-oxo-dGTP diphosphatase